jgi:ParB/RepB/Spo0J family partition protein
MEQKAKHMELPLSKLVSDKLNPRKDIADINELAESIEQNGQQVPVKVEDLKDGRYLITDGHRRQLAFNVLKKKTGKDYIVSCWVESKLTDQERLLKQTVIDVQTKNWTVPERDAAWKKLWNTKKYTKQEFRKLLGANNISVDNFFDRTELGADVMKLDIGSDVISETKSLDIATRKKLLVKAAQKGYGCRQVRQITKTIKDASESIKNATIDEDISLEQAGKLKSLSDAKQSLAIDTIKHINKQVKTIPKLIDKDKISASDRINPQTAKIIKLQEFIDRLQEEIGNASGQMMTIEGVLHQVEEHELDKVFTPKLKNSLASVLEELKDSIAPAVTRIEKTIAKWRS